MPKYVIGVDFGTESGRAVVVDTSDGREIAGAVYPYANGVIDERCPKAANAWSPIGRCRILKITCALSNRLFPKH